MHAGDDQLLQGRARPDGVVHVLFHRNLLDFGDFLEPAGDVGRFVPRGVADRAGGPAPDRGLNAKAPGAWPGASVVSFRLESGLALEVGGLGALARGTFLGALIYDGVFDRFPALRGGCIEQGAGWVVSWMHHLDYGLRAFKRTEEPLRRLASRPSDYVREHLKFTPFPGEDVGWMMGAAGEELFMFSTDFPHPEGGKDPRAKFEETLTDAGEEAKDRFYYANMAELLHGSTVPA